MTDPDPRPSAERLQEIEKRNDDGWYGDGGAAIEELFEEIQALRALLIAREAEIDEVYRCSNSRYEQILEQQREIYSLKPAASPDQEPPPSSQEPR